MGKYRYEDIEERLNRIGGSLRPPARTKREKCEDRTKAGRLAYWTEQAQKDLDSAQYWNIADSLRRLAYVREENGREGWDTALWSAVVIHMQTRLYFVAERTCEWIEIWSEEETGVTPFQKWQEMEPFRMDGTAWEEALDRLRRDGRKPFETIDGIETFCLLASPQECIMGLGGGKEVSKRVFDRLTETCRASWPPARGTGRSSSPPCARRGPRWRSARCAGSPRGKRPTGPPSPP